MITVGEKIGKTDLNLTATRPSGRVLVAALHHRGGGLRRLPASTTHVLSSGIAGTMAANGSGLQWSTIRHIIMGWVLTLPVAMMLSATLYWAFSQIF